MTILGLPSRVIRAAARLLVLSIAVSSTGLLLHGDAPHDSDCDPLVIVHDASQHRVTADAPSSTDHTGEHCAACHFARAFRSPQLAASGVPALSAGPRLAAASIRAPRLQLVPRLPVRAPPSLA